MPTSRLIHENGSGQFIPGSPWSFDYWMDWGGGSQLLASSPTSYTIAFNNGAGTYNLTWTGNFVYGSNAPASGTVTSYVLKIGSVTVFEIYGVAIDVQTLRAASNASGRHALLAAGDDYALSTEIHAYQDTLAGGNDTFLGYLALDFILGEAGNDYLFGGGANDTLSGGDGFDTLVGDVDGAAGVGDALYGDAGNDYILGGGGNDDVWGGDGGDTILGQSGSDDIYAGAGNDYVIGDDANDAWNDFIYTDAGADTAFGGAGNDIIHDYAGTESDVLVGGAGNDDLQGGDGNDYLYGDYGAGASGNDTLNGGFGDDVIDGGPGADSVQGRQGTDYLFGGGGADTLRGEPSGSISPERDFYWWNSVDELGDVVIGFDSQDVLILRPVLDSLGIGLLAWLAAAAGLLLLSELSGDLTLSIDVDGNGAGAPVAAITLQGYTAANFNWGLNVY